MLYYNTIRYLKPVQIFGRVWFKLRKPAIFTYLNIAFPGLPLRWISPGVKQQSLIGEKRFRFLNTEYSLKKPTDWYSSDMEKLFLYHLHYFDDLNAEKSPQRRQWHIELIDSWIKENTTGQHEGWEPYPLSLRITNWIKWLLQGNDPPPKMLDSLMSQVDYLSKRIEFYLQGNHLLANAKALLFGGLFFKHIGKIWYQQGLSILNKQLPQQILVDGGHIERSTQYHCLVLEDILDCINILQAYNHKIPSKWPEYVGNMLKWLSVMRHPDGEIALFNDAALNAALHPTQLFDYAKRLGLNFDKPKDSIFLSETGYVRLIKGRIHILIDVAPLGPDYLPGHAHADTFTFECSLEQQRVIVNSGTSTYEKNVERLRQRGTSAHNTLVIDNQNSSEVWDSFRVARRAKVRNIIYSITDRCEISAVHDGYCRLGRQIIHKRTWQIDESSLLIIDDVVGTGQHYFSLPFHVYPNLAIKQMGNHCFAIFHGNKFLARLELDDKLDGEIASSTYHPEFGLSIPSKKIIGVGSFNLPLRLTSKIACSALAKEIIL